MTKATKNGNDQRLEFRTTYMSERAFRVLGEHALSLPAKHPARATIKLLLERWAREGRPVTFIGGVTQAEVEIESTDELEDLMQEAA